MPYEYVRFITTNSIPKAMTIEEMQTETEKNETLQAAIAVINTGDWSNKFLVPYKLANDSLTINHAKGIILQGNQIVMPKTLWKRSV